MGKLKIMFECGLNKFKAMLKQLFISFKTNLKQGIKRIVLKSVKKKPQKRYKLGVGSLICWID